MNYTFTAERVHGALEGRPDDFVYCTLEVTKASNNRRNHEIVVLVDLQSFTDNEDNINSQINEIYQCAKKAGIYFRFITVNEHITAYESAEHISVQTPPKKQLSKLYNLIRGVNYIASTSIRKPVNIHIFILVKQIYEICLIDMLYEKLFQFSYSTFAAARRIISSRRDEISVQKSNNVDKDIINYKVFGHNTNSYEMTINNISRVSIIHCILSVEQASCVVGSNGHQKPFLNNKYVTIVRGYKQNHICLTYYTVSGIQYTDNYTITDAGNITEKHKKLYYSLGWAKVPLNILRYWTEPMAIPWRNKRIIYDIYNIKKSILGGDNTYLTKVPNDIVCIIINYII